jgi:hypothetical protein
MNTSAAAQMDASKLVGKRPKRASAAESLAASPSVSGVLS